jgi:hypothetical protein
MSVLAKTFAATTRDRRGETRNVGRMVPWRISLVIDSAPRSDANRAVIAEAAARHGCHVAEIVALELRGNNGHGDSD